MPTNTNEPFHTYQDLMARFGVSYCTIWRWFHNRKRFKPTGWTVRVPDSEVNKFIAENTGNHAKTK